MKSALSLSEEKWNDRNLRVAGRPGISRRAFFFVLASAILAAHQL